MLVIHADWDSEARCWYATSDDIPGLATGADTFEDPIERLKVIVPELVELNEIPEWIAAIEGDDRDTPLPLDGYVLVGHGFKTSRMWMPDGMLERMRTFRGE